MIICGAGDGGELLLRELLNNPEHQFHPVCFVDDDARKAGKLIRGYCIFDSSAREHLVSAHNVNDVLIASYKMPEARLHELRPLGGRLKRLRVQIEDAPYRRPVDLPVRSSGQLETVLLERRLDPDKLGMLSAHPS